MWNVFTNCRFMISSSTLYIVTHDFQKCTRWQVAKNGLPAPPEWQNVSTAVCYVEKYVKAFFRSMLVGHADHERVYKPKGNFA